MILKKKTGYIKIRGDMGINFLILSQKVCLCIDA